MSDVEKEGVPIVLDMGSSFTKAGFAGEESPTTVFPTVVGRPRRNIISPMGRAPKVGEEALKMEYMRKYPIEHGIVTSWDDVDAIWNHLFYR